MPLTNADKKRIAYLERVDPSIGGHAAVTVHRDARASAPIQHTTDVVAEASALPTTPATDDSTPPPPSASRQVAQPNEASIVRTLSNSGLLVLNVLLCPERDAYFSASDFELTLATGEVIHGSGPLKATHLSTRQRIQVIVQFQAQPGTDFSGAALRWYYSPTP